MTAQALLRAGVRDGNIIAGYHTSFDATRPLIARLAVTAQTARDASVTLASVRGGGAPTPMEICANIIVHTQGRGRPRRCWPRIGLKRARMFCPA